MDAYKRSVKLAVKASMLIAGFFALLMMVLIFADVLARLFLNKPIPSVYENTQGILMGISIFLAMPAANLIRIKWGTSKFGPGTRRWITAFGLLLVLGLLGVWEWQSIGIAINSLATREATETLISIPIFPARLALCLGIAVFIFLMTYNLALNFKGGEDVLEPILASEDKGGH